MEKKASFAGRILSLDVFRGVTIAGMILVNCPGNDEIYRAFRHSQWNGCTLADLVFPSFLVIMGISSAIALGRRRDLGKRRATLFRAAAGRALSIFCLGLATSLFVSKPDMGFRIMGVLQRIGLCACSCAGFFLYTEARTQALLAALGLLLYWILMTGVPVPGIGPGVLTPEGNLASYLDRLLLAGHIYHHHSDPEGLLSTLPAVSTSLIGVLAGHWLRLQQRHLRKAGGLLAAGAALIAAGGLWSVWFPINKEIWTSSYGLYSAGWALTGLALCYWVVEIRKVRSWATPFKILGRNPLLCYFLSALFYGLQEFIKVPVDGSPANLKVWICSKVFEAWLSRPAAALAYGLSYTAIFIVFMAWLYRRKVFLRI